MDRSRTVTCETDRAAEDSDEDSNGDGCGMGMETVMNSHGPVGILWRFSNGRGLKRKRLKHAINVVVAV